MIVVRCSWLVKALSTSHEQLATSHKKRAVYKGSSFSHTIWWSAMSLILNLFILQMTIFIFFVLPSIFFLA